MGSYPPSDNGSLHRPLAQFARAFLNAESWPPAELKLYLTKRCNSKCVMCGNWSRPRSSSDELKLFEIRSLAEQARQLGVMFVTLFGGEPTLRHDLTDIVAVFTENGIATRLITNCIELGPARLEELLRAGLSALSVSIDSPDEALNDHLRGVDGAFRSVVRTCAAMASLSADWRRPVTALTVLSRRNVSTLRGFPSLLRTLAANDWILNPVLDPGDAQTLSSFDDLRLTEADVALFNSELEHIRQDLPSDRSALFRRRLYIFTAPPELAVCDVWPTYSRVRAAPCYLPWSAVVVREDGVVVACNKPKLDVARLGNLRTTQLAELWNSPRMRAFREMCVRAGGPPFTACDRCCYTTLRRHWVANDALAVQGHATGLACRGFPRFCEGAHEG